MFSSRPFSFPKRNFSQPCIEHSLVIISVPCFFYFEQWGCCLPGATEIFCNIWMLFSRVTSLVFLLITCSPQFSISFAMLFCVLCTQARRSPLHLVLSIQTGGFRFVLLICAPCFQHSCWLVSSSPPVGHATSELTNQPASQPASQPSNESMN